MNITAHQQVFVQECEKILSEKGIRVISDLRNEKIGFKIREHTIQRVPYLLVIGDREVEAQTVSVRTREGQDCGSMSISKFADILLLACEEKGIS